MIHQPLSGIRGAASTIEIHAKEVEKLRERINRHIAEATGKALEQVTADTDRGLLAQRRGGLGLWAGLSGHRRYDKTAKLS